MSFGDHDLAFEEEAASAAPNLSAAEREALADVCTDWWMQAVDMAEVAHFVRRALSAVPRLAGEVLALRKERDDAVAIVEAAWREGWRSGGHAAGGFPLASAARTWDDDGWECSEARARLAQIGGEDD